MPLPDAPSFSVERRARLRSLLHRTRADPPSDIAAIIRDECKIDLATSYGGMTIAHPFGKASGQLSCTMPQVEDDLRAGLAFIVLKTVIAEDSSGAREMAAWTVRDTKMSVESRMSVRGEKGWTVTWTGRGWHGRLADYLAFFGDALRATRDSATVVVPSVKYHLPSHDEEFRRPEYEHTTRQLLDVWTNAGHEDAMVLEKDFSPTLAGDRRSEDKSAIIRWLREVPGLIVADGEPMTVHGTATPAEGEPIAVGSNRRNVIPAGKYTLELGVQTRNGNLYLPVTRTATVCSPGSRGPKSTLPSSSTFLPPQPQFERP